MFSTKFMESNRLAHNCLLPLRIPLVPQHIPQTTHLVSVHKVVGLHLAPLELLLQIPNQHLIPQRLLTYLLQLQIVILVLLPIGRPYLLHHWLKLLHRPKHKDVD